MVRARTALEGSYLLSRIFKIRRWLYVVQIAVLLGLATLLLALGGASLDPFYIPIPSFLYIVLIMLFLIALEGFFFRIIEIRYNPSESRKFLMASNSIRTAIIIIIITAIIGVVLFLPPFQDFAVKHLSYQETLTVARSDMMFTSQDRFALSDLESVEISINQGGADVYILTPDNYRLFHDNNDRSALHNSLNPDPAVPIDYDLKVSGFAEYYIVYDSVTEIDEDIQVKCDFTVGMSDTFTFVVPVLCLLFTISHAIWVIYLIPIKKKYAESSIYV